MRRPEMCDDSIACKCSGVAVETCFGFIFQFRSTIASIISSRSLRRWTNPTEPMVHHHSQLHALLRYRPVEKHFTAFRGCRMQFRLFADDPAAAVVTSYKHLFIELLRFIDDVCGSIIYTYRMYVIQFQFGIGQGAVLRSPHTSTLSALCQVA